MRFIILTISYIMSILAVLAPANSLYAQDTPVKPEVASLPLFITTGLKNNYDLRIVRNEERMAENSATRANAGYLPTITANTGYDGSAYNRNTTARGTGDVTKNRNTIDHTLSAGLNAEWTVFDGFKIQTNYKRLQELRRQSATQTRIAIEDYVADLTAEYYNFIQQHIRMRNLNHAVALSKERLRIVLERYSIGSASRLDMQQAQVDFNADSAQSVKQHELLASSRIRLYSLMAVKDLESRLTVRDTAINVTTDLTFDTLWSTTLRNNASLIKAAQNRTLAELDLKSIRSRDFPYIKLGAGYNYSHNIYGTGSTKTRDNWGADFGVKIGLNIFDGNKRSERRNAKINIENAELAQQSLEQSLKADLADLWQAYQNNLRLLALERQNLLTAQENHYIAYERYMLGDLSGIEMREAQQSLLDTEERILEAEYNTKLCEISLRQLSGSIMVYLEE
ncbi:TolC family protein [Xylanibacter muris]|uniref:TolC family protein n=1 Tax=Xylanibacter muris TaxID=2736290 RepID=A0ABX2ANG2_9BACT|nr:TolC family protein [Xylanibacter muris]NPD91567.1 TolC family protein [Xylanibacter muris]